MNEIQKKDNNSLCDSLIQTYVDGLVSEIKVEKGLMDKVESAKFITVTIDIENKKEIEEKAVVMEVEEIEANLTKDIGYVIWNLNSKVL